MVKKTAAVLFLIILPFSGFSEFSVRAGTGCGFIENTPFTDTVFFRLMPGLSLYYLADDTMSYFLDASGYADFYPATMDFKTDAAVSGDISYKDEFFILMLEAKSRFQQEISPGVLSWENILRLSVSGGNLDYTLFLIPGFSVTTGNDNGTDLAEYGPTCSAGVSLNPWDMFIVKPMIYADCGFRDNYLAASVTPGVSFSFYPGGYATVMLESGYTWMMYSPTVQETGSVVLPDGYRQINGKIDVSVSFSPKITASLFAEGNFYFYDSSASADNIVWELMPEISIAFLPDRNNSVILGCNIVAGNNNDTMVQTTSTVFSLEWEFCGK